MSKVTIARMVVKPESVARFIELANVLVVSTNKETGCEIYKLYQELGATTSFLFYEEYKDQDALDFHFASSNLKEFLANIQDLLAEEVQLKVF